MIVNRFNRQKYWCSLACDVQQRLHDTFKDLSGADLWIELGSAGAQFFGNLPALSDEEKDQAKLALSKLERDVLIHEISPCAHHLLDAPQSYHYYTACSSAWKRFCALLVELIDGALSSEKFESIIDGEDFFSSDWLWY